MPWSTWRSGIARLADIVGAALFGALVLGSLLGGSRDFQGEMVWLGLIGTATCWLAPGAQRTVPTALVAFTLVVLLSARLNFEPSAAIPTWLEPAEPALAMLVFVYGAAHFLRRPMRLSLLAIGVVGAVSVIGAQILFDRARTQFVYERIGSSSIPLAAQWGSLHQTGMLFCVALPFALAVLLVEASLSSVLAGAVVSAGLLVFGYVNGSRTGVLAMAVAAVVMAPAAGRSKFFGRVSAWVLPAVLCAVAATLVAVIFLSKTSMPVVKSMTGDRLPIWTAAAHIALDHPLLGVGPGRYSETVVWRGYADAHFPWYPYQRGGVDQAHNLVLHTAAETGVPGALLMVAVWWTAIAACWRAWRQGIVPLLALGFGGALLTLFVRVQADNFLDNLITADRTRVLVGAFLAAALAIQRLTKAVPA